MRICPYCQQEVPEFDFVCPHCNKRLPSQNKPIVGHASLGNLDEYNTRMLVSQEDKNFDPIIEYMKSHPDKDGKVHAPTI